MKVLVKEPGKRWEKRNIENTLEALQEIVGGYIETLTLTSDMVAIFDEEGRIKDKEWCVNIAGVDLVGTVILTGILGDDFADLDPSIVRILKAKEDD